MSEMDDEPAKVATTSKQAIPEDERDDDFELTAEMLIHGNYDDEGTLEEEEMLEDLEEVGSSGELTDLQKESEMPLEELLAMYGYSKVDDKESSGEDSRQLASSLEPEIGSSASFAKRDQQLRLEETEPLPSSVPSDGVAGVVSDEQTSKKAVKVDKPTPEPVAEKQVTTRRSMRLLDLANTGNVYANWLEGDSDEDEDYCGYESWKKDVKVGRDFQAEVNDTVSSSNHYSADHSLAQRESLLWRPNQISDDQISQYLNVANKLVDEKGILPGGSLSRDNELALLTLKECQYNINKAVEALTLTADNTSKKQQITNTVPRPWSEEECRAFESGLRTHGKKFHVIQKMIPARTVRELVHFYYLWKKTERHDLFAQQARLGKKKYSFQPGKFQDYMQKHLDDLVSEVDENAGLHCSGRHADDEASSSNTSDSIHINRNTVVLDSNGSSGSSEESDYYNDELRDKKRKCDPATIDTVAVTEKRPREM